MSRPASATPTEPATLTAEEAASRGNNTTLLGGEDATGALGKLS
jgi:hypothetical protein